MTTATNTINWIRHPASGCAVKPGVTLYSACGPFEWAGDCAFEIASGNTIGKPYRLSLVHPCGTREFVGSFKTVSGAKKRAKNFGTWRN